MFGSRGCKSLFLFLVAAMVLFASPTCSDTKDHVGSSDVPIELLELGQRGELIARAREQTLEILEGQNSCSAWFQESDADAADIFRSLHFTLTTSGQSQVSVMRDDLGFLVYRHPWAAKVAPFAGRNALIFINANGPFFLRDSPVDDTVWEVVRISRRRLTVGIYDGDTDKARMTILLHELGHVIGRIPKDDDPWSGQSGRNTEEVLRHCKKEIASEAKRTSPFSN